MPRPRRALAAAVLLATGLAGCSSSPAGSRPPTGSAPPSGPSAAGSGSPAAAPADGWVRQENARPGTAGWRITRPGRGQIAGWAAAISTTPGADVPLYVSTDAPTFTVHALRIGWYAGVGAREVFSSPPVTGHVQPAAVVEGPTRTARAPWSPSTTLATAGWPPGDYLLRLDASTGAQTYVPLTLRTVGNAGRVVVVNAVTTWQAYNRWGGRSLYTGPGGFGARSYAVSFDRPYDTNSGAGLFLVDELPFVQLAESLDLNLGYTTSVDLHTDATTLDGARALISLGHDEYWSPAMRDQVTAARDRGMNLAFLGANAVFRRIRMAPSPVGPDRVEIDYKEPHRDPLYGKDNAQVTADWPAPPNARPQSELTGASYECNPVLFPLTVTDAGNWLFAGSGVRNGDSFPDLVGSEYDRVNAALPLPRPLEVLAHSRVTCRKVNSFADMTYYSTPSGAGVLNVATNMWVRALDHAAGQGADIERTYRMTAAVTTTMLRAFAAGPAGRLHPAQDNLDQVKPYAGDPLTAGKNLW